MSSGLRDRSPPGRKRAGGAAEMRRSYAWLTNAQPMHARQMHARPPSNAAADAFARASGGAPVAGRNLRASHMHASRNCATRPRVEER
eukprot:6172870-Pleurochrysis_carterae.AAC.5